MAYGFAQWQKEEGAQKSPRLGALEKILAIIDNIQYPRPGWGLIPPAELLERIRRLRGENSDGAAGEWNAALDEVVAFINAKQWLVYCKDKFDPKELVTHLKKLVKDAGGSADVKEEKKEDAEEEE